MGDILSIIEQRTINDRSEHHRGADAVRGRRQGAPARTLREDHAPHHHAGRARMALRRHPGHHHHRHRQGQAGRQYLLRRIQRRGRPGRHGPDPPGDLHLQRRPRLQLHIPAIGIHRAQTHRRDRHRPRARRPLHARRQPRNPAAGQRPGVHRRGRRRLLHHPGQGQARTVERGRRRQGLQRVHPRLPEQVPPLELAQVRARRILRHHPRRGARLPSPAGWRLAERPDAHLEHPGLRACVRHQRPVLRGLFPDLRLGGALPRQGRPRAHA